MNTLVLLSLPIILYLSRTRVRNALFRRGLQFNARGEWDRARSFADRWGWVFGGSTRLIHAQALLGLHRVEDGLHELILLEGILRANRLMWFSYLNDTVNTLITAGRYQEALAVDPMARPQEGETSVALGYAALVQINLAEAEYNLGRWDDSARRLEQLDDDCGQLAITRAGLMLQRAWIYAHQERGEEATRCAEAIEAQELPANFRTERHYSRAAARLACGRLDDARQEVQEGLAVAMRPSSGRNGLFLLARIAALESKWEEAARTCAEAAAHPFQLHGGDGLLLWGDVLTELGRREEARQAWALAVERDPQGESAQLAARRLEGICEPERPSVMPTGTGA